MKEKKHLGPNHYLAVCLDHCYAFYINDRRIISG